LSCWPWTMDVAHCSLAGLPGGGVERQRERGGGEGEGERERVKCMSARED